MQFEWQPVFKRVKLWFERGIYVFALIIVLLAAAYWYWTTTPSYALARIVSSLQNHDSDTFEKYIDIDAISGAAFDDLLTGPARAYIADRAGGPVVLLGVDFLRFFKNDAINIAHAEVLHFVRDKSRHIGGNGWWNNFACTEIVGITLPFTGSSDWLMSLQKRASDSCPEPETSGGGGGIKQQLREFGLNSHGFRGIKYFNISGNQARLGLEFFSPRMRQNWTAEFLMEESGGYWRITQMSNLNELVRKYIAAREVNQL